MKKLSVFDLFYIGRDMARLRVLEKNPGITGMELKLKTMLHMYSNDEVAVRNLTRMAEKLNIKV